MEYKGIPPFNASRFLQLNDALPPGLNVTETALGGTGCPHITSVSPDMNLGAFYDTGDAYVFMSTPLSMGMYHVKVCGRLRFLIGVLVVGQEGRGFITIEHVLVRLNTSYAPAGKFLRTSNISVPDASGNPTFIGYDAAVCLQLFEPWLVEMYNSTTSLPSSTRLIEYGNVTQQSGPGERRKGPPLTNPNVSRQLNSSNLSDV